jgi:MSHA biogenesis protein MshP
MKRHQRGFSAALVMMVLVLLGGMLTYAVTLTSGMHSGTAQEIMQARALQAANTGLEWQRYRIRVAAGPPCVSATSITNLTIPFSSGPMPVTVRCTRTGPHGPPPPPLVFTYQISATACSPAAAGGVCPNPARGAKYVERQVGGIAEKP